MPRPFFISTNKNTTTMTTYKFKYWNSQEPGFRVQHVECKGYEDIKRTVARIREDRPDFDNIEVYDGEKKVTGLYDLNRKTA